MSILEGAAAAIAWRCPACGRALELTDGAFACELGHRFAVEGGVPHLVEFGEDERSEEKLSQARFFDDEDAEFETERPHATPLVYGALLERKLARATSELRAELAGSSVLCACGGSGLDAEYLARLGARPLVAEISPRAAERARERGRRYGLPIDAVVCDLEALPLEDRSVDFAFVHDGLHHISDPWRGLDELCRVARRGICVTEPVDAFVTGIAVRFGLADAVEEAGNRVRRLRVEEVAAAIEAAGFSVLVAERYGMRYRHQPGWLVRLASRPRVNGLLTRLGLLGGKPRIGSRIGNKLAIQAIRER